MRPQMLESKCREYYWFVNLVSTSLHVLQLRVSLQGTSSGTWPTLRSFWIGNTSRRWKMSPRWRDTRWVIAETPVVEKQIRASAAVIPLNGFLIPVERWTAALRCSIMDRPRLALSKLKDRFQVIKRKRHYDHRRNSASFNKHKQWLILDPLCILVWTPPPPLCIW